MTSLAATLRERREYLGVTQRALAKVIGTTQSHLCDLENGHADPRFTTVQRWADALGQQLTLTPIPVSHNSSAPGASSAPAADRPPASS